MKNTKFKILIVSFIVSVIIFNIGCTREQHKKTIYDQRKIVSKYNKYVYQVITKIEGHILYNVIENNKTLKIIPYNIGNEQSNSILNMSSGFPITKKHIITEKNILDRAHNDRIKLIDIINIAEIYKMNKGKKIDIIVNHDNVFISIYVNHKDWKEPISILSKCNINKIPEDIFLESENMEIAIINVESQIPNLKKALELNTKIEKVGKTVFTMGYALPVLDNEELNNKLTESKLSQIELSISNGTIMENRDIGFANIGQCYIHSSSINYGMIGGPLINQYGKIIGVNIINLDILKKSSNTYCSITMEDIKNNFPEFWEKNIK